jgi:hypothetical protein
MRSGSSTVVLCFHMQRQVSLRGLKYLSHAITIPSCFFILPSFENVSLTLAVHHCSSVSFTDSAQMMKA